MKGVVVDAKVGGRTEPIMQESTWKENATNCDRARFFFGRPRFRAIPTLTRTSLTTTIIISSPCLLAARNRVSSFLVQTSSILSTKFASREPQNGHEEHAHWCATRAGGWMKTTLYRDKTTLCCTLFEDRVAPRHQRELPDGVDRCVCILQFARTTTDGVSYMASCRTAVSWGQRGDFESHARQMEQDDRFVNGVLTAQLCDILVAWSDIMIVSDVDLPSKPSSKYIVTSHSPQPASSTQPSSTSDSILCTAHALLEACCHLKAKLLILTIAHPDAWEVLFHVELCNCFTHAG